MTRKAIFIAIILAAAIFLPYVSMVQGQSVQLLEIEDSSSYIAMAGEQFIFAAILFDETNVSEVWAEYWYDDEVIINLNLPLYDSYDSYDNMTAYAMDINISTESRYMYYQLMALDIYGNTNSTETLDVIIWDYAYPTAISQGDINAYADDIVEFSGYESYDNNGIVNYTWFLGDVTLYGMNVSHTFTTLGSFTKTIYASLSVHDIHGNSDSDSFMLRIDPPLPDNDYDDDGHINEADAFPYDSTEYLDSDGDGIGNNADPDDDNDNVPDINDPEPLNPAVTSTDSPETPANYTCLIILVLFLLIGLALRLTINKQNAISKAQTQSVPKVINIPYTYDYCPKCGMKKRTGITCPNCASKAEAKKSGSLSDQEVIRRLEKAYQEGKISEKDYNDNMARLNR